MLPVWRRSGADVEFFHGCATHRGQSTRGQFTDGRYTWRMATADALERITRTLKQVPGVVAAYYSAVLSMAASTVRATST